MKALTLHPEWIWAILHLGKNTENRVWDPRRQLDIGERFAVHAGKYVGGRPSVDAREDAVRDLMYMAERAGWIADAYRVFSGEGVDVVFTRGKEREELSLNDIPHSAVVAVATLADVRRDSTSPWAVPDQFHWELTDVIALPWPVACRGNQGLWKLPLDVETEVDRQFAELNKEVPHGTE